jgi:hypothetical protein
LNQILNEKNYFKILKAINRRSMKYKLFLLFFILKLYANAQSRSSSSQPICTAPNTIEIKKFDSGKHLKVVIGDKITYSSKGDKTPPMNWKMGKLSGETYTEFFNFSTDPVNQVTPVWSDGGEIYIPKAQLPLKIVILD